MATYVNDLRLKEIATGDESGTWGTSTNTNLELIGEALSFGTEAITTNADTHTTTVADGASDPGRAMYLKYTGTLDSACTITIAPNTISRMQFIENATSGSQNIIISQGSGANVTIPAGDTKAVYLDGAGSGAAVVDAFASLNVVDLKVEDDLTVTDDASIGGDATITGTLGVSGLLTANANLTLAGTTPTLTIGDAGSEDTKIVFDGNAQDYYIGLDDSADDLVIGRGSAVGTTPNIQINSSNDIHFSSADSDVKFYFGSAGGAFGSNSSHNVRASGNDFMFNSVANYIYEVSGSEKMRLDSNGKLLIGDTASHVDDLLQIESPASGGGHGIQIRRNDSNTDQGIGRILFGNNTDTDLATVSAKTDGANDSGALLFSTQTTGGASAERLRIDSSGRVGINRTPAISNSKLEVGGADNVPLINVEASGATAGFGIGSGNLSFFNGTSAVGTIALSTGTLQMTAGALSSPTYSFVGDTSTGMSRPTGSTINFVCGGTERVRIDNSGVAMFGTTDDDPVFNNAVGASIGSNNGSALVGVGQFSCSSGVAGRFNRTNEDGAIIGIHQAGTQEGTISVSGSTVSYNGFSGNHETSGIASDTAIGTVCSTIDELDTYMSGTKQGQTRADHAKIKVSDAVGDTRVYGVLTNFDSEIDNKPIVASVGIGSILVTGSCVGGDLLESNGDGTAKVQDDDIIRSKTIGKVTIGNSAASVKLVSCVLYCG